MTRSHNDVSGTVVTVGYCRLVFQMSKWSHCPQSVKIQVTCWVKNQSSTGRVCSQMFLHRSERFFEFWVVAYDFNSAYPPLCTLLSEYYVTALQWSKVHCFKYKGQCLHGVSTQEEQSPTVTTQSVPQSFPHLNNCRLTQPSLILNWTTDWAVSTHTLEQVFSTTHVRHVFIQRIWKILSTQSNMTDNNNNQ